MSEDYGSDFIVIEDEDGNEFELEHLETFVFENNTYMVFLPADMDEDDEEYGYIFLKSTVENGEEVLVSIDDDAEEERVYEHYMSLIFDEED